MLKLLAREVCEEAKLGNAAPSDAIQRIGSTGLLPEDLIDLLDVLRKALDIFENFSTFLCRIHKIKRDGIDLLLRADSELQELLSGLLQHLEPATKYRNVSTLILIRKILELLRHSHTACDKDLGDRLAESSRSSRDEYNLTLVRSQKAHQRVLTYFSSEVLHGNLC